MPQGNSFKVLLKINFDHKPRGWNSDQMLFSTVLGENHIRRINLARPCKWNLLTANSKFGGGGSESTQKLHAQQDFPIHPNEFNSATRKELKQHRVEAS